MAETVTAKSGEEKPICRVKNSLIREKGCDWPGTVPLAHRRVHFFDQHRSTVYAVGSGDIPHLFLSWRDREKGKGEKERKIFTKISWGKERRKNEN
jgi:hypothetical protein